jgi:hypothetical protein
MLEINNSVQLTRTASTDENKPDNNFTPPESPSVSEDDVFHIEEIDIVPAESMMSMRC